METTEISNDQSEASDHLGNGNGNGSQVPPPPELENVQTQTSNEKGETSYQPGARRRIQKVPIVLLKEEKNRDDYFPKVVSIGPYHHGKPELHLTEAFKPKALDLFVLGGQHNLEFYRDKVLEKIHDTRESYQQQSTDTYSDHDLARMMLLDACFIIIHMEASTPEPEKQEPEPLVLVKRSSLIQHLGMLTGAIVNRDLFLLENQVPFFIVKLLIRLRYERDEGEKLLNRFMNITLFGEFRKKRSSPTENREEPLHLVEALRTVVVPDCVEHEKSCLCFKRIWLCCFRAQEETSPDIETGANSRTSVDPGISAAPATGVHPAVSAGPASGVDPSTYGICRWLCCFRVAEETSTDPATSVSPAVDADIETGIDPTSGPDMESGADPTTRVDPSTGADSITSVHPAVNTITGPANGVDPSTYGICRWLRCFRVTEETGANPATSADIETGIDPTSRADTETDADPATRVDLPNDAGPTTGGADRATRQSSRLSQEGYEDDAKRDIKQYVHSFRSATDLKAKGIHFKPSSTQSLKDVKFKSKFIYAQLELPTWGVSIYTKVFFLNMIAFELSPNNPNMGEVTSYINLMKSLIESPADVKELREKKILYNMLGSDEEVLNVYKDINTYGAYNPQIFHVVKEKIQAHYNSKPKTWIAELIHTHFRTPWTIIALLAAMTLLALASVQVHYKSR
ncbi:hypothetical protein Pfo_005496 [Paulownia fortunei]|nr:hypothetical protein Pfo_005496 [Paulownia fortunei]